MNQEISSIINSNMSRSEAYSLVRRYNKNISDTCTIGLKTIRFLCAGHDLQECMLQSLLKHIQLNGIKKLKDCRMRLCKAAYLVGAPDPTNTLLSNQVLLLF